MKSKSKILIIDDDRDSVLAMRLVLDKGSFVVTSVPTRKEGVSKAKELKPDLIILDVVMAESFEGFETSFDLAGDVETARIPILMVTAMAEKTGLKFSPEEAVSRLPISDFIEKPIDPKLFLERVEKLLSIKR